MKFDSNFLKKTSNIVGALKKSIDNDENESFKSFRNSVKNVQNKVAGATEKAKSSLSTSFSQINSKIVETSKGLSNGLNKGLSRGLTKGIVASSVSTNSTNTSASDNKNENKNKNRRLSLSEKLKGVKNSNQENNIEIVEEDNEKEKVVSAPNISEIENIIVDKSVIKIADQKEEIAEHKEDNEEKVNLAQKLDEILIANESHLENDEKRDENSLLFDYSEPEFESAHESTIPEVKQTKPLTESKNIFKSALEAFRRGRKKNLQDLHHDEEKFAEDFDKDVPPAISESAAALIKPKILESFPKITGSISSNSVIMPSVQSNNQSNPSPQKVSNTVGQPLSSPVYADYASLTPIDPRVKKVMFEAMDQFPANPSSLYKKGVLAKKALEDARMSVAAFFGANKNEIFFTSGGTETNNLVFQGVLKAFEERGSTIETDKILEKKIKAGEKIQKVRPHFIISTIEHPSIIEIALDFINKGIDVSFIPVNEEGLVDPKDIKKVLRSETILISIIYANNEIGTVQPLKEIAREVRHFKKSIGRDNSGYPYIHTDACQAALYEDMRINTLNIDLMTIDGGKVYGPRGIGALVKRRHVNLSPIFLGGSQEEGLRAGTENLTAIIGLKHALDIAHNEREDQSAKLLDFRDTLLEMLMSKLQDKVLGIKVNGTLEERLPNNLNICFPGIDAEFLVLRLDVLGIELSSVTSCRATNEDASSYVIEALGRSNCALSSLRISLGRFTTTVDIGNIAEKVSEAVLEQNISIKN